ncbi:MAG: hypothetical protein Q9174_001217 [Haloplaca sp. 1 TL-2023]
MSPTRTVHGRYPNSYTLTTVSYSNYSSISTFNETGEVDFTNLFDDFEDAYTTFEQDAGYILSQNLQDHSARCGLSLAGWKPEKDPAAQAIEWWEMDWEYSVQPELTSHEYSVNTTFYQYSDENNFVIDERGFNAFLKGEASTFLTENDPRLLLDTVVTGISQDDNGITILNDDGSCVHAKFAIFWAFCNLATSPSSLSFQLGSSKASRHLRWAPSLDGEGFHPGSGILFVTVVQSQSYAVEAQDDETTKNEVLGVLRKMFGPDKVPEPIAFMYPRWSLEPWAYGSYSNWPPGTTLQMHQNLRANVGRLHFAGEATSAQYFGFLHGAWFEGQAAGQHIADIVNSVTTTEETNYEILHGTTPEEEYESTNGWQVSPFLTYGFE